MAGVHQWRSVIYSDVVSVNERAVSQSFNHLLSCVYAHAYMASICGSAEQIVRVVGWRPGPWWKRVREGGGGCLLGALPSAAMVTLGCLSPLAANEIDPVDLARTKVPPFRRQGRNINQTGAKYLSSSAQKEKL